MTFYQDVLDPPLVLWNQAFTHPVRILSRPTYGRVLFTSHDVRVEQCSFFGEMAPPRPPLLALDSLYGVVIRCCYFGSARK